MAEWLNAWLHGWLHGCMCGACLLGMRGALGAAGCGCGCGPGCGAPCLVHTPRCDALAAASASLPCCAVPPSSTVHELCDTEALWRGKALVLPAWHGVAAAVLTLQLLPPRRRPGSQQRRCYSSMPASARPRRMPPCTTRRGTSARWPAAQRLPAGRWPAAQRLQAGRWPAAQRLQAGRWPAAQRLQAGRWGVQRKGMCSSGQLLASSVIRCMTCRRLL
jgi:hypothetical protein